MSATSYASKVLTYQVVAVVEGEDAAKTAPELAELRCWAVVRAEILVTEEGQQAISHVIPAKPGQLLTLAEAHAELGALLLTVQAGAERVAA